MGVPNIGDAYRALAASGLDFTVLPRLIISDQDEQTIVYDFDAPENYIQLMIQSDSDVHYRWDDSGGDTINADNDLVLFADTTYILTVPVKLAKRVGADIFVHFKQLVSVASKFIKVVKI